MLQYAVDLIFPSDISEQIGVLRQDYLHYINYSIEPHITLVYPFVPEADITLINEKLKQVAERTKAFSLVLDGIEYFAGGNNVAYIAIANKQSVIDLHYEINQSIDGLIADESGGIFNYSSFTPHVTIGSQIPDEIFPEVKKRFSGSNIHHECKIASLNLSSGGEDGVWRPTEVFSLMN